MKFTDVAGIMNIPYVAEKVKLSHVAEIVKLSHVAGILEAGSMYDPAVHHNVFHNTPLLTAFIHSGQRPPNNIKTILN